jgi:hypothetical protein
MKAWTGIEIEEIRYRLEHDSALNLGRILFEFARLDMDLGLCLVWVNQGRQIDELTEKVGRPDFSFHRKLDLLKRFAKEKYSNNREAFSKYRQWIVDADVIRLVRNDLVHGRWGIDHMNDRMINVIGVPTSPKQSSKEFTVNGLENQIAEMQRLRGVLSDLRTSHPL